MASITIRFLSFLLPHSLGNTFGVPNNGGGVENFLKINDQKGWNKLGGFKYKNLVYFD